MINKGFLRRFSFYLFGVALGILMVMAIFKDRNLTSWTPKNQIISEINEKPKSVDENSACIIDCLELSNDSLLVSALKEGKIDYKNSDVRDTDDRTYLFLLEQFDGITASVEIKKESCNISFLDQDNYCSCP